ncbi:MAG: helix-turn-helix domain-containing protein [Clostridia bacterium]|nr:helix-turn-helix domain-containing protein [Clostridia bacterium]
MDFIDRLKLAIEKKGISITLLAKQSGLSRQSIYKLLNRQANSTVQTLNRICEVLEVPITEILSKEERESVFSDSSSEILTITVDKDNMYPLILCGDTAKIKLQKSFNSNDIILVNIENAKDNILKRVKIKDDIIFLFDINNSSLAGFSGEILFNKEDFEKKVKVIGKLIETVRNFN